jgi:hypothetical protein
LRCLLWQLATTIAIGDADYVYNERRAGFETCDDQFWRSSKSVQKKARRSKSETHLALCSPLMSDFFDV